MQQIYVLKCENGRYYVGKTSNIDRRFAEHFSGHYGSEWTRYYAPLQVIEVEDMNSEFDEMKKTLEYMKRFGIDKVRGAQWSNITLTSEQRAEIMRAVNTNGCFHCGQAGHFANNCPNNRNRIIQCQRCGRDSHLKKDCYATFNIYGEMLDCGRCGRDSHCADECFAKTHINGCRL